MSKTWYPIINYELCNECGYCIRMCEHGVYNKEKAPRPIVVNPEGCIESCQACGVLCPSSAIEYFGDDKKGEGGCCNCGRKK